MRSVVPSKAIVVEGSVDFIVFDTEAVDFVMPVGKLESVDTAIFSVDLVVFIGIVDLIDAVFVTKTVDLVKRVGKLKSVVLDVFKILLDDGKLVKLENAEFVLVKYSSTALEVVKGGLVTFVVVNLRWFSEGTGS